ncbi:MAG: hypothetical protein IJE68_06350 [Clostridia bacterium]|nr:hypothetical protein [Clostridia bacterium]
MKENKQRNINRTLAKLVTIGMWAAVLIAIIPMIVGPIIGGTIHYQQVVETHQQEMESYSTETYDYLLKSISLIFREDEQVIDINAKPDDIIIEKIEMQDNGNFICELYLDKGEEKKYFPDLNIIAELSSEFDILYTSSAYASEEEFVKTFKANIKIDAMNVALKIFCTYVLVLSMLLLVPWAIINAIKCYKRNFQRKK